jgi:hypothetical protein
MVVSVLKSYLYARRIASREGEWRLALVGDKIRWHGVGDMNLYMCIKTSASLPVLHVSTVAELFGQMINAILPFFKGRLAKSASRLDILCLSLPRIHTRCHFAAVPVHVSKSQ